MVVRRWLYGALTAVAVLILALLVPVGAEAEEIIETYYVDEEGVRQDNIQAQKVAAPGVGSLTLTGDEQGTCFLVVGEIDLPYRVEAKGNVVLILADGCMLKAEKGIHVGEGNSLTIYGQEENNGEILVENAGNARAGIGGDDGENAGNIIVYGGVLKIEGGNGAAGIGGGNDGNGGKIVVGGCADLDIKGGLNGGAGIGGGARGTSGNIMIEDYAKVVSKGRAGAGIGGGQYSANNNEREKIIIYGGIVEALNDGNGAGIGGGSGGSSGIIEIYGGTISAQGYLGSAGIGGGNGETSGGNIIISGGEITAVGGSLSNNYSGYGGAGIGGGHKGAGGTINITGGTIHATGGSGTLKGGDGIGNGGGYAGDETSISFPAENENGPIVFAVAGTGGEGGSNGDVIAEESTEAAPWHGIIFEGTAGQVYGNQTLSESVEIPANYTLIIPRDVILTVPSTVTLTNNGSIDGNGTIVGSVSGKDPSPSVIVDDGKVTIGATVSPENGGEVTGSGDYDKGSEVTLTAIANEGHHFVEWTEDAAKVENAVNPYTFNAEADRNLTAVFAAHSFNGGWQSDENGHWQVCSVCKAETLHESHEGGQATCLAQAVCTICGQKYGALGVHSLRYVPQVDATYSSTGTKAHYACEVCNQLFLDEAASKPVTESVLVIPRKNRPVTPTQTVTIAETVHGAVMVSPKHPSKGDWVTITAYPDETYEGAEVQVQDSRGKKLEVTMQSDGSWGYEQPQGRVTIRVTFTEISLPDQPTLPFSDVPEGAWYHDAVAEVYVAGFMIGVSETTFSPEAPMTRAMVVSILHRFADGSSQAAADFSDVDPFAWYADSVAWAKSAGIASGYEDGSFRPNEDVTREQLACMLANFASVSGMDTTASCDLSAFADADDISSWALPAMAWAVDNNVVAGMEDGLLMPKQSATRAEMAAMLVRSALLFS